MNWTVKVYYRKGKERNGNKMDIFQEKGLHNEVVRKKVFQKNDLNWDIVEQVITIPEDK